MNHLHVFLLAVLDELLDEAQGHAGNDVVDVAGDLCEAGVALEAGDLVGFRVYGVEVAGETHLLDRADE